MTVARGLHWRKIPEPPDAHTPAPPARARCDRLFRPGPAPSAPTPEPEAPAPVPAGGDSGEITAGGQSFTVTSVIAYWDAQESELVLVALPLVPDAEQRKQCLEGTPFFAFMGYDGAVQGFTDRVPFAEVTISWPFDPDRVGDPEKAWVHLFVNNLDQKNGNLNLNWSGPKQLTLRGACEVGGEVSVVVAGEDELMDTPMTWELRFEGRLEAALAAD